ncbi:hypothetical protein OUZ56_007337 [Daphnia magna]|uniref:Uncharacterized protein n=1 Tax=Daphnia magna TaxID=35525 RepID=A0ABQ9YYA4_9CRUS|nr:hypothetical protein OUZ56_007337 [Daphnia magna]
MKAEKVATLYGSNVNTSMRTRESFVIKSQFRNDEVSPYSVSKKMAATSTAGDGAFRTKILASVTVD